MTPKQIKLILSILELAFRYGVPAVVNAINALKKEVITCADIEELKTLIKPPDQY